ncbi:MAG: LysR family transcriptional regulator [Phycisphaerales bacterium]|jgi:DNA-binding transcriptional LysR family regulator|nr:LysR family transcriptional regulator [Phycisphaerales bacterium]
MELTALRQFVAICRARHVTRAAREMGVTQSALSAMLKRLEAELGSELLHRTARGVSPTEAGQVFLRHAEETIRSAEAGTRAVREIAGLQRGSLRLGGGATAVSYILPPVISAFRAKHPGVTFYVREAGSGAVAAAVASGDLDIGIVTLPLSKAEAGELIVTPLVDDELRLIDPPRRGPGGLSAGASDTFRWRDLEGVPVIAFEAGTAVRAVIDDAARAAGVRLNVVMELRSIEGIKGMVAAGVGVGFVSRFALRAGEGRTCKEGRLSRKLALVRSNARVLSGAGRAFEVMVRGKA